MADAESAGRVAKVDAGKSVAKKDVAGRVVEPLVPVSASSSGIAMLAQAKLSVGRVDDPAELEADQMAQKFSHWNGAGRSVEVSKGSSGGDAMRSADTGTLETGGFEVGADVQSEISSRSGRGVPLADDQRSKFEQFFGKDLSAVRVHADSDASQLSGSLGAEAFTVGNDVYFGSGRYKSGASDKLLAHELTHVVQQNSTLNRVLPSIDANTVESSTDDLDSENTSPASKSKKKYDYSQAEKRFGKKGKGLTSDEFEAQKKLLNNIQNTKNDGYKNTLMSFAAYTMTFDQMESYVAKNKNSKVPPTAVKEPNVEPAHDAFKTWTGGGGLTVKDKMMMCYLAFEQNLGHEDDPPFRIGHFMSSNYNYENTEKHTTEMWDKTLDTDRLSEVKRDILTDKEKEQAIKTAEIMQNIIDLIDHFQGLNVDAMKKKSEKPKKGEEDPEKDVDARVLFSHGGRVNIKVAPRIGSEALDAIGITENGERTGKGKKDMNGKKDTVHSRTAATHGTRFKKGESYETGGRRAAVKNWFTAGNYTWGMDLAIGGAGNLDYNGRVIKCDGSHGHLMINWTAPTDTQYGVLMVGVETTGYGAKSMDGYEHTWASSEATANLMATAGGLKAEKSEAGASKRLGMHEVDLTAQGKSVTDLIREAKLAKSEAKAAAAAAPAPVAEAPAAEANALAPPDDEQFGWPADMQFGSEEDVSAAAAAPAPAKHPTSQKDAELTAKS